MVIRVDRLIYIYMALCACLLLFNLAYTGRRKLQAARNPGREKWWQEYLEELMLKNTAVDRQKLERRLSRPSGLLAFQEAYISIRQRVSPDETRQWFRENRDIFIYIGTRYLKKNVMVKAYYAHVVWQDGLCGNSAQDAIARYMLGLAGENSIYCRENALQALYSSKSPELVVKAYKIMERRGISHSDKLVTDGLAAFAGDKEKLIERIWEEWDEFSAYYQTAFINFMRLSSGSFGERMLPILGGGDERELQFAVLRYLRKYHIPQAEPILQKLVREWRTDDWEFPALAASALENYPSEGSLRALFDAMHSTNWYVRSNASDSLIKIAEEAQVLEEIFNGSDQYAKHMLRYKLERRKEECGNDGCD